MPNFPDHKNDPIENGNNSNSIFNIGGIKIPEGNKLAIWFLTVTVIAMAFVGYGFWHVINRVLDSKLGPEQHSEETIIQNDYNNLLKKYEETEALNKLLVDSLNRGNKELIKRTDSVVYNKTEPYIQKILNK